jgi:hypothetical protein
MGGIAWAPPGILNLPYLSANRDRHGNVRLYVRRNGGYVRIKEIPGTPEFLKAYVGAPNGVLSVGAPVGAAYQATS